MYTSKLIILIIMGALFSSWFVSPHQVPKDNVKTKDFWDGVANIYSKSDLTHHMADFEMDVIELAMKYIKQLDGLACLGAADGKRDPIGIMNLAIKHNKGIPEELIVNDISPNMVQHAQKNVDDLKLDFSESSKQTYTACPIHLMDPKISGLENKRSMYITGVYNVLYLKESLKLYSENTDATGRYFTISALVINEDHEIEPIAHQVTFDIFDYEKVWDQINALVQISDLYAISLVTDKSFVSHYFSRDGIEQMLTMSFPACEVISFSGFGEGSRYIVNIIKEKGRDINYVITMLNNVLGNVQWHEQFDTLRKIKNAFFEHN